MTLRIGSKYIASTKLRQAEAYKNNSKLFEVSLRTSVWLEKANKRGLLKEEEYQYILQELKRLPKEINHLINFTNEKLSI